MYLYENPALAETKELPITATHIAWLPEALSWARYPHMHQDEYEISMIFAGCGELRLPGTSIPVEAGSLTIVPPQTAHYFYYEEAQSVGLSYATLRFHADPAATGLQQELQALGVFTSRVSSGAFQVFCHLKEVILADARRTRSNRIQPVSLLLSQAVFRLAQEEFAAHGRSVSIQMPVYANDILLYLQHHTHQPVRIEDLAEEFHLSQSHIFRIFTQTYHLSPIRYLIFCRMSEARTLLLQGNMTVPEIARHLAYKTTYHFVKTFEQFYHCSPYEYKEPAE